MAFAWHTELGKASVNLHRSCGGLNGIACVTALPISYGIPVMNDLETTDRNYVEAYSDGTTFTGSNVGPLGSLEIENGKIDGNTLTWTMQMTVPMPLTLNATATIDGDTLTGTVNAGAFGDMPMTGTRKS